MYLADLNERAQNCLEVIIKQMKAAEMFREHEIFYLSDQIVN